MKPIMTHNLPRSEWPPDPNAKDEKKESSAEFNPPRTGKTQPRQVTSFPKALKRDPSRRVMLTTHDLIDEETKERRAKEMMIREKRAVKRSKK